MVWGSINVCEWYWMVIRDILSSGNEIPELRLLGWTLFEDLTRKIYTGSTSTLESYRWMVLCSQERYMDLPY